MDDTNTSRGTDASVAATRKRRSSILKSQRPPRTPFSELEFNVATPTDTVKSRRVSFSKRTGVAEFVTNEATTTWKNFYEEHNKSMESSGNDSEMHPARAVVSLGKKIFDQQFEEVEAIDLLTTMDNRSGLNINHSIQNANFAPFEMTAASLDKLTAPKTKFELSTFTDHQSKVFGDDLALTNMEVTEGMDINFSNIQPLSEGDDLDEIEKDIGRVQSNVICHGPFNMRDMSGYIEVDLNMTHVVMKEDESDMSITNSVHIPKVDDLSKSITLDKNESNKDWLVDKENIAINPYAAPRETDNFAINKESDKVLVFDGKRLTIQSEKEEIKSNRHTMLPNPITIKDHRKTITLNTNDDLPNFFDANEALNSENISYAVPTKTIQKHNMSIINDTKLQTVLYDEGMDISITQALPTNIAIHDMTKIEKQRTIVFGKDTENISITEAVPVSKIVFDNDANISITEGVPSNIILNIENKAHVADIEGSNAMCMSSNIKNDWIDNKKTIVYENNDNISITQTDLGSILPLSLKAGRRQTVVFDDDGNMSMTQAIPNKILSQEQIEKTKNFVNDNDHIYSNNSNFKLQLNDLLDTTKSNRRQTMVFGDDGNMSMTQTIPNKILSHKQIEKRKSTVCDNDNIYSKSTESDSKPEVVNGSPDSTKNNRRQTMIFEDDGNMSMTQAIPNKILSQEQTEKRESTACDHVNFYSKSANNHSVSEVVNSLPDSTKTNKRQTMLFSDDGNMSITQAIPNKIISQEQVDKSNSSSKLVTVNELTYTKNNKRQTIMFDDDVGDISITRALPTNILNTDVSVIITDKSIRREQMTDEDNTQNISKKDVSPSNVILKNAVKQDNNCNNSMASSSADNIGQSGRSKNQCAIGNQGNNALSLLKDNSYMNLSQGKCHKLNTIQSDNTIGGTLGQTSINMLVNDNSQIIVDGNEDELEIDQHRFNQSKHKENISNISKTFNSLAHVSNKISNCQEIVGGDSETKCNSSVYIPDLSVNLECDISATKTLSDGIHNCKGNNESQIKLTTINNSPKKDVQRNCTEHNTSINQYFKKHVNLKAYILDDCIKTAVKPIPMELSTTQDKIIKSEDNKVDSTVMEPIHQNVLVYQSFKNSVSHLQLKRTEQGDVKSDRTLNQCDVKSDSSTIVTEKDDIKSNVDADKKSVAESKISTTTFNKEVDVEMADIDKPVSILDELLDMSTASLEGGLDDKYCTAKVDTPRDSVVSMKNPNVDNTSNESMFYITRDSDEEAQTEMSRKGSKGNKTPNIDTSPLPLEYKEQQPYILEDVQNKVEVKAVSHDSKNSSPQNRHYEKVVSSDVTVEDEKLKERLSIAGRSFKTADDTNDLLKLLSDFTDKKGSDYIEEEDEEQREPIVVKGHIAIENKSELEPKRLSFAPNRQSIVISREDLLNNISMAHATLQKSRYELDLSDSIEDTKESLEESCHKKSVRISSEVVKALHFDDDTTSELSVKSELKLSPLKKTAFGETSYMKETKANVIPTYLKDVSDNIKALMSDLVKPVQDVMPFDVGKSDEGVRRSNSTCSTQIQANLITSSQIDLESNINSDHQLPQQIDSTNTLINSIANSGNQAIEHALKSALKSPRPVEKYSDMDVESADESFNQLSVGRPTSGQYVSDRVLIFDHNNPLNNVLLAPPDLTEVHRYNPKKSTETICFSERSDSAQISVHDTENENNADNADRVSTQYLVKTSYIVKQGGDTCRDSPVDTSSIASNISKPMSIDESTDVKPIDVKHTQVNTMIAMKGTKQLLEASSSLTLVDDALARPEFDINLDTNPSSQDDVSSKNLQNPVKTIFKNDIGDNTHKVESDITSNDEETEPMQERTKKRVYSPANIDKHKNCTLSSLDLTPRPFSKMQKISETPRQLENNDIDERPVKESKVKKSASKPIQERKTSPKIKNKKPGTSVTVQQLLTEYNMQVDEDTTVKSESTIPITISKSDEDGRSVDMISSFTSSKNLNEINNRSVSNTVSTSSKCSKSSRVEWQPELDDDSSKNQIAECDASVNVVAKIDMLPFMGSQECEWESCSGDTWCFRLLHARLRLVVRLAHRHGNAARTRVAAHTPVLAVAVHVAHQDRCGSVASACVRLAAEAMRRLAGGACACAAAGAVPALLRRCRAVARAALRWGRAMHDARSRLAYTLTDDGHLALKVANVALRSVWEVTMRLELAADEEAEAPWPRAADVRVAGVVSDYKVTEDEVQRALRHVPHDWGHVPRTVWRIFKYLKHKTRSDELLDM